MIRPWVLAPPAVALFVPTTESLAHHGRGNRYDMNAEIAIEGTVRELFWRNPHIAIIIDVEGKDGESVPWVIEHSNVAPSRAWATIATRPGRASP